MSVISDACGDMSVADKFVAALHELAGICGHCNKRKCAGRKSNSRLPEKLNTDDVLEAIQRATGEEL